MPEPRPPLCTTTLHRIVKRQLSAPSHAISGGRRTVVHNLPYQRGRSSGPRGLAVGSSPMPSVPGTSALAPAVRANGRARQEAQSSAGMKQTPWPATRTSTAAHVVQIRVHTRGRSRSIAAGRLVLRQFDRGNDPPWGSARRPAGCPYEPAARRSRTRETPGRLVVVGQWTASLVFQARAIQRWIPVQRIPRVGCRRGRRDRFLWFAQLRTARSGRAISMDAQRGCPPFHRLEHGSL